MRAFRLDRRLAEDTVGVGQLGLCDLRLMNDSRWPWLILVPKRAGIIELHDLTPLDQTMLTFETGLVAKALKSLVNADKINVGSLGNMVPMLHLHVIARRSGDPNWPGPVWGFGAAEPYAPEELQRMTAEIRQAVMPG
ncbi:HIT domain-containing protein [Aurantimonas sp. VKM B-3413]|uniref:HIT domain-containing protein n=1 Tax=Aurantimonas sp. VKM B-3413 TaxID=2779401 RepID=UPI001E36121A|nr:HIT family protein [Aurantimonas sp. VKM B-3413]MCB8837166.1 HIT family protein [Aurantimonas sp. VKM B-3413]